MWDVRAKGEGRAPLCVRKRLVGTAWPRDALAAGCLFHTQHTEAWGGTPNTCRSINTSSGPDHWGLRDPKGRTSLHPIVGQLAGRREELDAAVMATEVLKIGKGKGTL